ncbi:transcriptional activator RfaH [Pusillimonas caeni]|uniref:transcriptional activator RfaH n=1 Tax=Pusillimonas caeni TaxID=1348472 RepID=UPI00142F7858|nr:transcriptional activator RfaH [Pusillimonas caeni]
MTIESPDLAPRQRPYDDPLPWVVAYTKPRQESVARDNAERQGFRTYLPMYRIVKRAASAAEGPAEHREPMFPRYLFVKPARAGQSLAPLRSTRGIHSLVSFGDELATMPDERLDAIRRYEAWRSRAEPHVIGMIQPGSRVRLKDPALEGLEGLVQAVSSKRVIVLLALLGRQHSVKVEPRQLELA